MERTTSGGAGAAEGMVMALAAALMSELALPAALEGGGIGVPPARRRFESVDDVVWRTGGLAGERAADEDALDRLSEPMLLRVL